ncbi:hypothetical protein F4861DRAFT_537080 [Xylaria intraflava]|nr:hypothetical protein F4861DRAFT_537080 [Xylaria intraflava]
MRTLNRGIEQLLIPLGQRRGRSDPAVGVLDLTWGQEEKESAQRGTRAYPSPPMSGSPPRPPKHNQEVAERGQGSYQTLTHDAYRAGPVMSGDEYRTAPPQPPLPPPLVARRPLPSETPERPPYPYRRSEDTIQRPVTYPPPSGQLIQQPQYSLPPVAGPALGPTPYPLPINPPGPENPAFTSPKSQRKTKGHVASACVPCKRAHLRCDAQRPCSRCLSNGKEDTCIDVQHKKRGRPRLRDDREPHFDTGRFAHPPDPTIRRPHSLYTPSSAPLVPFDDPLRRSQPYRVLKSQPREVVGPMFIERGSATDTNIFPAPSVITPQAPEPVAFLTIGDLEVVKASSTFIDATISSTQSLLPYRSQAIVGRKLTEIITPPDRDRVLALCKSLQNEQVIKEPNYLPPIYGRDEEERVIKSQPFNLESVSRYQLDRQEIFTFVAADGQPRQHSIRIGLVKDDSIYFVVLLLIFSGRSYPPPSPTPRSRGIAYSYQTQPFTQLTPVPAPYDPSRPRLTDPHRELSFAPRQPETPAQLVSVLSPGMNPNILPYSVSAPARGEQSGGLAHQIPRSELSLTRPTQQADYQLPPIRSHRRTDPPPEAAWQRDDRTSRLDIGGLIEKPEASPRRHL